MTRALLILLLACCGSSGSPQQAPKELNPGIWLTSDGRLIKRGDPCDCAERGNSLHTDGVEWAHCIETRKGVCQWM